MIDRRSVIRGLAALPLLASLLSHHESEIVIDVLWTISYISEGSPERIQATINTGVIGWTIDRPRHLHVIAADGSISSSAGAKGSLRLVEFANPQELTREGNNLWAGGTPLAATNTRAMQGFSSPGNPSRRHSVRRLEKQGRGRLSCRPATPSVGEER